MESIWPSLIGTLVGGAIAIIGSVLAQRLAAKAEREKHSREKADRRAERLATIYADVIQWAISVPDRVAQRAMRQGDHDRVAAIVALLKLHADQSVVEAMGRMVSLATEMQGTGPHRHSTITTMSQAEQRAAWLREHGYIAKLEGAYNQLIAACRTHLSDPR